MDFYVLTLYCIWVLMQIEEMETQMKGQMNLETLFIGDKELFEQLCTEGSLLEGWHAVRKNRGSPGIDGQTIEDFEMKLHEEIRKLKEELESWKYEPQPVRRVEIPKPDGCYVSF